MMNSEMQACIEACSACYQVCLATIGHCLKMGGKHAEAGHIRLMQDCVQICAVSADFMLRESPHHKHTCEECAEICAECAADCRRVGSDDEMMRKCAETCERCAGECREMAG